MGGNYDIYHKKPPYISEFGAQYAAWREGIDSPPMRHISWDGRPWLFFYMTNKVYLCSGLYRLRLNSLCEPPIRIIVYNHK